MIRYALLVFFVLCISCLKDDTPYFQGTTYRWKFSLTPLTVGQIENGDISFTPEGGVIYDTILLPVDVSPGIDVLLHRGYPDPRNDSYTLTLTSGKNVVAHWVISDIWEEQLPTGYSCQIVTTQLRDHLGNGIVTETFSCDDMMKQGNRIVVMDIPFPGWNVFERNN